ncbi:hypothetical protein [Desulfovibrio cuneatus]|uniref:hypothetical protein n=1 Tax=Desulfovibrio cuneatus TaxID=159728 RepID=UPI000483FF38|nr:hypothetical protein [Desulfovibrio cuneatus]
MPNKDSATKVVDIIRDSGGRLVGRTRLQKIAYLLEVAGCGNGFQFSYHYYGPYSEQVADAAIQAQTQGLLQEEEKHTTWGTTYSVYKTNVENVQVDTARCRLIKVANQADAVDLELAATAAYLANQGSQDAWISTANLKPDKAKKHLDSAKKLYKALHRLSGCLPDIK